MARRTVVVFADDVRPGDLWGNHVVTSVHTHKADVHLSLDDGREPRTFPRHDVLMVRRDYGTTQDSEA